MQRRPLLLNLLQTRLLLVQGLSEKPQAVTQNSTIRGDNTISGYTLHCIHTEKLRVFIERDFVQEIWLQITDIEHMHGTCMYVYIAYIVLNMCVNIRATHLLERVELLAVLALFRDERLLRRRHLSLQLLALSLLRRKILQLRLQTAHALTQLFALRLQLRQLQDTHN